MRRLALAVVPLCALAGCGGSSSPAKPTGPDAEVQVRQAFDAYRTAMVDGDFARACRALAPSEAHKAQALVHSFGVGGDKTCASALRNLSDLARAQGQGKAILDTLKRSRVLSVTVDGTRATFRYRTPRSTASAGALQVGGRWRVTGVTGT